ncbi:hypothetical protein M0G74_09060 [Microbulbifer sp. CAU 1566]|uniref:hypothetical protein n=1 Tax=Microbulbifer sp. CAU 1566 TaxID=2933269 RepID=UPI0020064C1C|nr:hypothetical protein [Microbulbifer sp. CAU 1566]MCK7597415.1 hypothetical protein [Microbulbifer sp. CAU 1566]
MKINQEGVQAILDLAAMGYREHFEENPDPINLDEFAYSLAGTVAQTFYAGHLSPREAYAAEERFCEMLAAGAQRWIQRNRPEKVLN